MDRARRNTAGGMGVGVALGTVLSGVASTQGVEIDQTTATAAGSLLTAFFGWLGHRFS